MNPTPSQDIEAGVALLPALNKIKDDNWPTLYPVTLKTIIAALEAAATLSAEITRLRESEASWQRVHRIEYEKREALDAEVAALSARVRELESLTHDPVVKELYELAQTAIQPHGGIGDEGEFQAFANPKTIIYVIEKLAALSPQKQEGE